MLISIIALCLCTASPEEAHWQLDPSGSPRRSRPGTVLIGLRPEASRSTEREEGLEELKARISAHGARVVDRCGQIGLLRAEIAPGEDLSSACSRLGALPDARYAEPDWFGEGGMVVNDTYFSSQWHLPRIQAPSAWDTTRGSESVIVAVLDTGILRDHLEFVGRALQGHDFVNDDDDPAADHEHGIYTTGLLAANADNGFGVAGVDHRCRILPVKVLDKDNTGTDWNLINGIVYAADNGARVISMSLINYPGSDGLKDALRYAREKGVVLVACSGNGGAGNADTSWPGASPLCITVGATTATDQRAGFSGSGKSLDVVAPGERVVTVSMDTGDGSAIFSGCSAATPIAAGVASLLLSVDPSLTPEEIQELLQHGAEDQVGGSDDKPGWDPNYGWGRVNARRSLDLLGKRFFRGDANFDGALDISDVIYVVLFLFSDGQPLACQNAADANDDGEINITDPIAILEYLFLSGSIPGPQTCGLDYTLDSLECPSGCSR